MCLVNVNVFVSLEGIVAPQNFLFLHTFLYFFLRPFKQWKWPLLVGFIFLDNADSLVTARYTIFLYLGSSIE